MPLWLKITVAVLLGALATFVVARAHQARMLAEEIHNVESNTCEEQRLQVDGSSADQLPPPVLRYLNNALPSLSSCLTLVRYEQTGTLRTDTETETWLSFTATHLISPYTIKFLWVAHISVAHIFHIQIKDSFNNGIGSGQVLFLSAVPVESAAGNMEMNSGALHRFLAEAVWYPTALLPSRSLTWTPKDDRSAVATLIAGNTKVSLEFRFNSNDEVVGIYTPGRWGNFDGHYAQAAWEGKFRKYVRHEGILIPSEGEVGWYSGGRWRSVWRGSVVPAQFTFQQPRH